MVRVSGWSGPSLAICWRQRTRSKSGDRLGELAGGPVRPGEVVERGQGVGVVGAELGDLGVADVLEQRHGLGELAGGLVRPRGCSAGEGVGVVGAELGDLGVSVSSNSGRASSSLPAAWYAPPGCSCW